MLDNSKHYVSDELYAQITASFPVVCIDVIPVDLANQKIGVITRATGNEANRLALIGGRIRKDESIKDAILRHLNNDLGITEFSFYKTNNEETPFTVQQYSHSNSQIDGYDCYDPTKHSIGLTYLITINQTPDPKSEACDFHWIDLSEIPDKTAFNQGVVMQKALEFIKK